ncbi:MAG: hypothetical protein ACYC2H_10640, partial [Thermoplasmatota archaeon]
KDSFNHQASEGFIEIWSLPTETANAVRQGQTKPTGQKTLEATFKSNGKAAKAPAPAKGKATVTVKAKK